MGWLIIGLIFLLALVLAIKLIPSHQPSVGPSPVLFGLNPTFHFVRFSSILKVYIKGFGPIILAMEYYEVYNQYKKNNNNKKNKIILNLFLYNTKNFRIFFF